MKKITAITGRGIITDITGKVVAKTALPAGDHDLQDGFNYIEKNEAFLDALNIMPPVKTRKEVVIGLAMRKMLKIAATALVTEGLITLAEAQEVE